MSKLLYNVTIKVEHKSVDQWKKYMMENHILDMMNTGCFESFKLNKLKFLDEEEGITFAVQYITESQAKFDEYLNTHAKALQTDHHLKFGEKAMAFRTVMEIIHES